MTKRCNKIILDDRVYGVIATEPSNREIGLKEALVGYNKMEWILEEWNNNNHAHKYYGILEAIENLKHAAWQISEARKLEEAEEIKRLESKNGSNVA